MPIPIQEPVTSAAPRHPGDDATVTRHPAFAQISASRVHGASHLYGSDFAHQNTVRITVSASELHRDLATDWHFSKDDYLTVELSEAQWATFVSSLNVGSGVPCTLRYRNGEAVPDLPAPPSRADQFAKEMATRVQRALAEVSSLAEAVGELKISERAKQALLGRISGAHMQLVSNTKFIAERFDEHMEETVEKAKVEVNAYAVQTLTRAGLEAVQAKALAYNPARPALPAANTTKEQDNASGS